MTNRTTAALLAVVAVLLGLNLIVNVMPAAGDRITAGDSNPYIVKVLPLDAPFFDRVWSDGRLDRMTLQESGDDCSSLLSSIGPVEHPFPVVDAANAMQQGSSTMMRFEDGRVDVVAATGTPPFSVRCTVVGSASQSFCTADVNRDGEVAINDLLELLGQWGPCQ
jgi:hypothetical protein